MDFSSLLDGLSNNDPNASLQVEQLQQQNFGLYLVEMTKHILVASHPPGKRQLAALMVKNALTGRSHETKQHAMVAWLKIPQDQRAVIKNLVVMEGLSIADNSVRRGCAQIVAAIGLIELSNNEWPELVQILVKGAKEGSEVCKEGSLTAIGWLCEEIRSGVLESQSTMILDAIVSCADAKFPVEVRRASIRCMLEALSFVKDNFANKEQRDFIMSFICQSAVSPDEEIRLYALQCLSRIAEIYYRYLEAYIEQIWNITTNIIKSDVQGNAIQGIEFWSTVAETEFEILLDEEEDEEAFENPSQCKNFMKKICEQLVPILFEALTKQSEDLESDEWDIAKESAACITLMARAVEDDIVAPMYKLIEQFISSNNWRYQEASIMAFGSILEGPTNVNELIHNALPIVVGLLKTRGDGEGMEIIQETSAWAIGNAALHHPQLLHSASVGLIPPLGEALQLDPPIAYRACFSLLNVIRTYEQEQDNATSSLSQFFTPLIRELVKCGDRSDANESNLRITVYETINSVIENSSKDCLPLIKNLIPPFLEKLQSTFDPSYNQETRQELQSYISSVIYTICGRIKAEVGTFAVPLLDTLMKILEANRGEIINEVLLAITSIIVACENIIPKVTQRFQPLLLSALKKWEEPDVLISAINCLGHIAEAKGETLFTDDEGAFCDQVITILVQILQQPNLLLTVKPQIISAFGDLAFSLKGSFEKYRDFILSVLATAAVTRVDEEDPDQVDYLISLRESVLEAYQLIINGTPQNAAPSIHKYLAPLFDWIETLWRESDKRTATIVASLVAIIGDVAEFLGDEAAARLKSSPFVVEIVNFGLYQTKKETTKQLAAYTASRLKMAH